MRYLLVHASGAAKANELTTNNTGCQLLLLNSWPSLNSFGNWQVLQVWVLGTQAKISAGIGFNLFAMLGLKKRDKGCLIVMYSHCPMGAKTCLDHTLQVKQPLWLRHKKGVVDVNPGASESCVGG